MGIIPIPVFIGCVFRSRRDVVVLDAAVLTLNRLTFSNCLRDRIQTRTRCGGMHPKPLAKYHHHHDHHLLYDDVSESCVLSDSPFASCLGYRNPSDRCGRPRGIKLCDGSLREAGLCRVHRVLVSRSHCQIGETCDTKST